MAKKKIIHDKKAHDEKKRRGRQPTAPPTRFHKDKSRYNRTVKHKDEEGDSALTVGSPGDDM